MPRPSALGTATLGIFHAHVLDLRVARERLEPLLAPVAALLVSAERQLDAATGAVCVDVDLTGFDPRGERQRFVDVARPDAGDQTVLTLVRDLRRLLDVVEVDDREHRPEDLFLRDPHLRRYVIEKRRRKIEPAPERRIRRPLAAGGNCGAFAAADLHVLLDDLELTLRD